MVCARMLNILNLIDDARCFETVRAMRWPQGVTCPHCDSLQVTKQGHDESQPERQKYECTVCRKRFDDLTGTIFAGHHQPLRVWMLCLYFMGLNLSNEQIAHECGATPKLTPLTTLRLTPSWTLVKEGIWTTSTPIWLTCLTCRRTKRMQQMSTCDRRRRTPGGSNRMSWIGSASFPAKVSGANGLLDSW